MAKLDAGEVDALHAELLAFVDAFNRIDAKHGLDTLHREQIYDAFHGLVADSKFEIAAETLDEWFDEDREF